MKLAARLLNFLPLKRTTVAAPPARAALPAPLILALEPRIVYDGSAAAIGAAATPHHADVHHTDAAPPSPAAIDAAAAKSSASSTNTTGSTAPQTRTDAQTNTQTNTQADAQARGAHSMLDADATTSDKQVVFIDPSVANYQQLLAGLPAGTQYVILDSGTDGLAQMAQYLQQHPGVDAIHLISHGTHGAIQIGATWLTAADFSAYSGELAQIGAAMKPGGDFLIYGCDVAENADGKALVQEIASVSHLSVAASTDTTGAAALGGNWTLEYDAGAVHTPVIFSTAAEQQFGGSLGVVVETYDGSIGNTYNGTSFTLDGITYTSDQPSQFVDTSASDGSVPLSSGTGDGALEGNADSSSAATTLQMSLQNGDNMSLQSFDLDTFAGAVQLQAINASGATVGTLTVDPSSSGVTQNPDGSYHIDLSNNAAFSGIKSLKLVETDGLSLDATLDNFTYVDLNSPPALAATGGATSFTEADNTASTPVAIDSGITLLDGDAATAKQATISITGNFVAGQDVLQFSNTNSATYGDISASYDATHGVLTLTSGGTATIAQWQSALRAVTYTNTAANPNTANRTISITLTRDAFDSSSNTVAKVVAVHATDQTPIVTTTGGTTDYQAGAGATTIDTHVSVSDANDATQASATVSISGGLHAGDTLSFTNNGSTMGNIAASYDASTGVLTLTASGGATNAQWAAALSAVEFSSTSTALGNRTISFATNDGTRMSVAVNDTVDVTNPVHVTTDSGSAAFIEADNTDSTPVAVDSGLTISDAVTGTLGSATISITGNFHAGEDMLSFTNDGATMGNITVQSYDPATGVLTLISASGSATTAQWQNALRAVTYTDTALTPDTTTRTVSFAVTDSLGNTSDAATRTVTVTATDQTPILTTTGGTTTYVAGASPKTIDSGITVSDADNTTQQFATVAITGNFHNGDTLAFTNTDGALFGNIQASYSGLTGTLDLSSAGGTASDVQWANALAAVTFWSASTAVPANRTITFSVSDGTRTSTPKTDIVSITAPPTITTDSGSAQFISGDNGPSAPVAIDSGIVVTDGSSTTFASATVAIGSGFDSAHDVLAFANDGATMGNIQGVYDPSTGQLTLSSASATATLAEWQSALRSVTYTDTAVTPTGAARTVSFTAADGAGNTSAAATRTIAITATDQTPVVTTSSGTLDYVGGSAGVSIDAGVTVSDLDNTTLQSATVSITGLQSGDQLQFTNTGAISGVFNSGTGVLQLTSSGSATLAQWQSALESIQFFSSSTTFGNRTISFAVNDGVKTSTPVSRTIDVLGPPQITTDTGSASFISGDNTVSAPVAVDSGLLLTDGVTGAFASATVAITGNFHAGEDILSFTNDGATMGNITVQSYDAATGVLTLISASGTATTAQWQSALRSITYTDTAVTPDAAARTISFTALDNAGNTSNAATRTVTITATDQTPIVTTTGGVVDYVGGTASVNVDSGLTVSDLDNTTLQSATISITGFQSGDTLVFSNTGAITGAFDSATGVLQLTSGSATLAQWQSALESIQFFSSSTVSGNRTISFAVNDGIKASNVAAKTVDVLGPPQITTDPGSASFIAGDNAASTPVTIDSGLSLTDGAASAFQSATVAITGNFHAGEDILSFTNDGATMGNIAASYDAATGVLTLSSASGSATTAQWQSALDSITYTDTAITPNTATRTFSFTATDSGGVTSNTATRTVTVTAVDQTPIVTTTGSTTEYVSGTTAITIDNGISASDRDNATLQSATVSISGGFQSGDVLSFTATGPIIGSYDSMTGVLTLTTAGGGATIAQWDAALQSLNFFTSSTAAGNRTISVVLNDGTKSSAAATDTVTVLGPPRIATDPGSASFIEADNVPSSPIVVDAGLTLTDGASTTFGSATVAITGNFHSGEDVLAFTNNGATMGNISASYDAATGVLTLNSAGASATVAQWRSALASITYIDTAITPNTATRTISFTATDGRGVTSNSATRTVTVIATDQTPIVTSSTGTTDYRSGTDPATIDAHIGVTDTDGPQASATVSIGTGFQSGDTLGFANTDTAAFGDITASYDPAHGVLTLTSAGAATNAQWANALSAVTFATTSTVYGERTVSFATSDGTKTSATVTDTVNVTNAMVLAPDSGSAAFVQGDNAQATPVVIGSDLRLTDTNSAASPASATIAITGNFRSGEDLLTFTNGSTQAFGDITGSYDTATGVLTLNSASGTATLAQWQSALDAVTYTDTALRPNTANRTVSFSVTDRHGAASDTATRTVTVTTVDQTPTVTTSGDTTSYSAGSTPKTIDSGITVRDLDDNTQSFATVSIGAGFANGDTLGFANTSAAMFGNITASYDAATGVLTLTSAGKTATDVQWSHALSAVTFSSAAGANGSRTIAFVINDGASSSAPATSSVAVTTAGGPGMLSSTSDNSTPPAPPDTPPDAFGDAVSNKPSVLEELDDPQPVGTVPSVPTITFSDSNTHYPYIPGRTMVPPLVSLVPPELAAPNPSPFDLLPALAAPAVIPVDGSGSGGGFTIDISDLDGEQFADSPDVSVSLADGKGLPAWLHYDAGKGTLSGKMPGGSPDVHVLVQVRDASGHVIRREIVLAPQRGAAGISHMATPHASLEPMHEPVREASPRVPLPAGKPSLAHQFASARAALHVARPAAAAALAAARAATTNHDTGGRA